MNQHSVRNEQLQILKNTFAVLVMAIFIAAYLCISDGAFAGDGSDQDQRDSIISGLLLAPAVGSLVYFLARMTYGSAGSWAKQLMTKLREVSPKWCAVIGLLLWSAAIVFSLDWAVAVGGFDEGGELATWTIPFSILFLLLGIYFGVNLFKTGTLKFLQRLFIWQIAVAAAGIAILFPAAVNGPAPINVLVDSQDLTELETLSWETDGVFGQEATIDIPPVSLQTVDDGSDEQRISAQIPLLRPSDNHMSMLLVFLGWLVGAGVGALLLEPLRAREKLG